MGGGGTRGLPGGGWTGGTGGPCRARAFSVAGSPCGQSKRCLGQVDEPLMPLRYPTTKRITRAEQSTTVGAWRRTRPPQPCPARALGRVRRWVSGMTDAVYAWPAAATLGPLVRAAQRRDAAALNRLLAILRPA